ncbi:MAG: protein kinase, partial [Myxococcota bacterium]
MADESALFGRVLGSYRLESLIGVGAMGCVFRGEHTATGERCAIKLAYGKIDGVEARFQREIDTISALNHPNIVRIKDSGRSPAGLTYMVMELLVGPTLRTIIEIEAPLAACRVR